MSVLPFRRRNRTRRPSFPPRRGRRSRAGIPGRLARALRVLRDPRAFLLGVIACAGFGLVALPFVADAVNGALRAPPSGAPSQCRVVAVVDGDTLRIWCPATGIDRARLLGFDTPEVFSPRCASEWLAGQQATWALRRMLWQASEVVLVKQGRDRYDRALATLFLDGQNVATRMIADGHARPYGGERRSGWC